MRLLFFTDTHIRGNNPLIRKDDFYQSLKNKFVEIGRLSNELNVDYILHGGDWFDRPDISTPVVSEFIRILKGFNKKIYSVAGNHDIFGQNPHTINNSMLGLLDNLGIITLLSYEDNIVLEKGSIRVQLTGKPYRYDIDSQEYREFYIVKKREDVNYAINIVHGMLLNKPLFKGINCTLIEDILETEADITFSGHYHTGFGIKEIDSRYFVNPGSLVRITNYSSEFKRIPKVVLIELEADIKIKQIELKDILPAEKALDNSQFEGTVKKDIKFQQFYKDNSKLEEIIYIDITKIIEEMYSKGEISEEERNSAITRIISGKERLSVE